MDKINAWNVLIILIQLFIISITCYQTVISTAGMLKRRKKKPVITTKDHTFAVLVCAHNEETVVGQIVNNLKSLAYDKQHYDVYVIADNCTDKTAQIAREQGAIAMERHDPHNKGKGFGLEWMFARLNEMEMKGKAYDAVVVLDADNLVSRNFLDVLNEKLQAGYEIAQAYLDTKNPKDSWVTKSIAYAYWSTNHIYQLSRFKLGLSAQLGGTGMMISRSILKKIGWGTESLTEDLEFTAKYILETGKPIAWAHEAKIFDEKPLGLKASLKQRLRWMIGHINCFHRFFFPTLRAAIKKESLLHLDNAIYLIQPTRSLLAVTQLLFITLSYLNVNSVYFLNHWIWLAILLFSYVVIPTIGMIREQKARYMHWMLHAYVFGTTWIPVIFMAYIKRNEKVWSHTQHNRTLSEDEMAKIQS
ncbi:glycosyl transferase family protein [Fictibacillus macauensis ZFHKF-1]|uniref:Glycosyl transferase family protein n=1 Tax=Fictibacillus macauensis ZFHKF-1 TaxID=1196324 RepID=I8UKN7_9BACL|nr:glycosyltransferase family 2 protein [Fictibacillus macauensis]EIT87393.1 glycosyl transferase family protein [Fictibacillus macauensis ZFHKF-1]